MHYDNGLWIINENGFVNSDGVNGIGCVDVCSPFPFFFLAQYKVTVSVIWNQNSTFLKHKLFHIWITDCKINWGWNWNTGADSFFHIMISVWVQSFPDKRFHDFSLLCFPISQKSSSVDYYAQHYSLHNNNIPSLHLKLQFSGCIAIGRITHLSSTQTGKIGRPFNKIIRLSREDALRCLII